MNRLVLEPKFWSIPLAIWTTLTVASFSWNWRDLDAHIQDMALEHGRLVSRMMESMRAWSAGHGGVYVRDPQQTSNASEQDAPVVLLSPALMIRQIAETVSPEVGGLGVRLTSLRPLNPDNLPDPWEHAGLLAFDRGAREHFELIREPDTPAVRYMAPLASGGECLGCHGQDAREGEVRGAISIRFDSVALEQLGDHKTTLVIIHAGVWLLVSAITLVILRHTRDHMVFLQRTREEQEALVAQRTAELQQEVNERENTEARLRLFIESSGEGIFGVDEQGRCTFCNRLALKTLGYAHPVDLLGRALEPLLLGNDAQPLASAYRGGHAVHQDDLDFRRADGSTIAVEFRAQPLMVEGVAQGAVVSFSDITERRRNEAALHTLSDAVEHSPDAVVITNADGVIEYVNPRFLETTGYALDEVIGKKPGFIGSGRTPRGTYDLLWRTISGGQVWNGEFLNRKKNGALFWEDVSISPILDQHGRVTHFVAVKEDITERKAMAQKIWHQANYDALTGLPNRTLFTDRLQQSMAQADRHGDVLALLFVDLDRFKYVNDAFGHEAGDRLLAEAARRIQSTVRETDTVARMGGDEFTVILVGLAQLKDAQTVAAKIVAHLAMPFSLGAHANAIVSASVGIAGYPADGANVDELLRNADEAMYRAKASGRNRYCFYRDSVPEEST